jgi:hypothetical protein
MKNQTKKIISSYALPKCFLKLKREPKTGERRRYLEEITNQSEKKGRDWHFVV